MSFSRDTKLEIIENKPLRQHYKLPMAYGLFLYANYFTAEDISIRTRYQEVAEIYCWLASSLLGKQAKTKLSTLKSTGQLVYRAWLPKKEDRNALLALFAEQYFDVSENGFARPEEAHAFFAGAFLACGNITNPKKNYHIEFVIRKSENAGALAEQLALFVAGFGATTRRNHTVLYCKEVSVLQDLLTMMGASRASLQLIEVEMYKQIRNTANRQTNCETANISRQVTASTEQVMDIQLIQRTRGLDSLSLPLQEAANLRLANPEVSLRELCELSPTQVSRSGLHHRLASITLTAQQIREAQKQKGKHNV